MIDKILLGYEIGTGEPVHIPVQHIAVTGQTQSSGKTTTLEALVARSHMAAVAFITKRSEGSFSDGRRLQPYFRERADWQFVSAVLEATLRERMKFERAWIMRATKGARTLRDVQQNVRALMAKAKGLSADVYMQLDAYLEVVVPQIGMLDVVKTIDLRPGLNVMDLSQYSTELQSLVIRSTIEWIYENANYTLVIIPEAWEFIPQNRGSPVLLAAENLIRKGGASHNFVWLDSQDIASVHKNILRSAGVWILGVQREANEIKRALDHIPGGVKKPTVNDIMTLKRGQFYACFGNTAKKVYVQPAWLPASEAVEYARRDAAPPAGGIGKRERKEIDVTEKEAEALRAENQRLAELVARLQEQLARLSDAAPGPTALAALEPREAPLSALGGNSLDYIYQEVKARLVKEAPALLRVLATRPELEVKFQRKILDVDGTTPKGRIVRLLADGFFNDGKTQGATRSELKRTGSDVNSGTISTIVNGLVADGFLTRGTGDTFVAVEGMKVNIVEEAA